MDEETTQKCVEFVKNGECRGKDDGLRFLVFPVFPPRMRTDGTADIFATFKMGVLTNYGVEEARRLKKCKKNLQLQKMCSTTLPRNLQKDEGKGLADLSLMWRNSEIRIQIITETIIA